jgi:hypothetical protein
MASGINVKIAFTPVGDIIGLAGLLNAPVCHLSISLYATGCCQVVDYKIKVITGIYSALSGYGSFLLEEQLHVT